jgi:hypothetical protein
MNKKLLTEHYYNILLEKQEDSSMFDFLNPLKWIEKIGQVINPSSSSQGSSGRGRSTSAFGSQSEEPRYEMNFDVAQSMAKAGENSDDYYKWMAGLQGKNNRYRTSSMIRTRALASALSRRKVAEAGRLAKENPDVIAAQAEYDKAKNNGGIPAVEAAEKLKEAIRKAKSNVDGYDAAVRGVNAFSSGPMNLQPVERRGTGFSVGKGSMGQPIITGGSYKDPNSPRARLEADGILNPDGSINASRYEKDEFGYLNTEAGRAAASKAQDEATKKLYDELKADNIARYGPMPTDEEVAASRGRMAQEERNKELEKLKSNIRSRGRRTSPPRKPKRFTREELLRKGMNPDLADAVD